MIDDSTVSYYIIYIMEKELEYSVIDENDLTLEKWSETLRFLVEMETEGIESGVLNGSADPQKKTVEKKT